MTTPLVVTVPPEPTGDRPAAGDATGDVWQRRGPHGTASWYAAVRQTGTVEDPDPDDPCPFARGRAWVEVAAVFGPMFLLEVPVADPPPYTGEQPTVTEADPAKS